MSEGAEALAGHVIRDDQKESMEEMVEADRLPLRLRRVDAPGAVHVSLDLIAERGLTVMALDGSAPWVKG